MGEAAGAENLPTCRIAPGPDTPSRHTTPSRRRETPAFAPDTPREDRSAAPFVGKFRDFVEKVGGGIFFAANRYLRRRNGPTRPAIKNSNDMKKTFLILTALLLGAGTVSAQRHEKNILSVRGGMNVSSLTASAEGISSTSDSRIGYYIGISDEILLSRRMPLYLETGLHFSSRGAKGDGVSLRPMYLQVPVLVNYHIDIKNVVTIQPFAGVYYGLGIACKAKVEDLKGDLFGSDSPLRRSDLGVRLGVGVTRKHLYFGLSYDIGCLNQLKGDLVDTDYVDDAPTIAAKIRNNCFTLSVGYRF